MNLTHLNITWAPPFTWSDYPLTEYRLVVTEQQNSLQLYNRIKSPNVTEVEFFYGRIYPGKEDSFPTVCTLLEFRVAAKSEIGESAAGLTTGGFPIGIFLTQNISTSFLVSAIIIWVCSVLLSLVQNRGHSMIPL